MNDPEQKKEYDSYLDHTLRPSTFDDYIGQESIKENLKILLQAASERNHPAEHILFYGPPGLGKTTLAHLIAKETGRSLKATSYEFTTRRYFVCGRKSSSQQNDRRSPLPRNGKWRA